MDCDGRYLLYSFIYPHLICGVEFWGDAADCCLEEVYLLQKTILKIILKINPRGHVTFLFEIFEVMPIKMLLKHTFLILYMICTSSGEISPILVNRRLKIVLKTFYNTRSKLDVIPTIASNCREERSLCMPLQRVSYWRGDLNAPGFWGRLTGAKRGSGA